MKRTIALLLALVFATVFSLPAFASDVSADKQKAIERNLATDKITDIMLSLFQANDDNTNNSDVKSFKGRFLGLFKQLNQLRIECGDLWSRINALNQNIKTAWTVFKESLKGKDRAEIKRILTDLKAKIDPLRAQIETLKNDIKTLRAAKAAEWSNFWAAVKAKDESKAVAALKNIIDLKKQIIEKLKSILQVKQDILKLIK